MASSTMPKPLNAEVDALNSRQKYFNSVSNYYSNTTMAAIAQDIDTKYRFTSNPENVMTLFSFVNCSGLPSLRSGVGMAFICGITTAIVIIAFYGGTLETVNINKTW